MRSFHYSLRSELLFWCCIISIIPIIIMQTVFYNLSQHYIEQKINVLINKNLSYIKTNIESDLGYYEGILYRIDADDSIIENAENVKGGNDFAKESCGIKLRELLASYADIRDEITAVTYVDHSLNSVFYDKKNNSSKNFFWDSYSMQNKRDIYNTVHDSNRVSFLNTKSFYYNNEINYLYHLGIRIRDIKTGEDLGIILLSVDEQHLQDICNLKTEDNNTVKDYSFVEDESGNIISFSDKSLIGFNVGRDFTQSNNIDRLLEAVSLNQKSRIMVNTISVADAHWKIINLIDKDSMFYDMNALGKLTLTITVLIIVICTTLIAVFTNKFYKSVNDIVKEMKKAKQGDFSAHLKLKGESELIFISSEFNDMVLKISGLVENLKQQNDYIYEISNRKREAEINAVVSQIKPHFLYNTLDCINWIAIRNEDYEISQMIGNLAQILRYSIRTVNEQVTIFEAIEWLKKYIFLYSVRLNNSFTVDYSIDDEALSGKIYKLLLQPIIENAIIHGFKGRNSENLLTIQIHKIPENLLEIVITDNGVGMSDDKLDEIVNHQCTKKIGLENIYERLALYYEGKGSMSIRSQLGKGTTVTVILPFISD